MHTSRITIIVLLYLFVLSCDQKRPKPTDNPYKFQDYISYTTSGRTSITNPIRIGLAQALTQFEVNQELPANLIRITPKVKGTLTTSDQRTLVFTPDTLLEPDTEYGVSVRLDLLYDDFKGKQGTFNFAFKTIKPDFVVNLGLLQSYDKQWQYLEGTIQAADVITGIHTEEGRSTILKKLLKAEQDDSNVKIHWYPEESPSRFINFRIDSIARAVEDSWLEVAWNGEVIDVPETKDKSKVLIPGLNNFKVLKLQSDRGANPSVAINFSDPLKENQNFRGLVAVQGGGDLRFEVEGNTLHVYPSQRVIGDTTIEIFQGIQSTEGYKLKELVTQTVSFEQLRPAVRKVTNGAILPQAQNTPFYFEAVNLSHVDVRVIKVFENNVLAYLQENRLDNTNTYNLKQVGRRIAKKTIALTKETQLDAQSMGDGWWKVYGIDLSKLVQADPGALYRVEVSFRPEYALYACEEIASEDQNTDAYYEDYYGEEAPELAVEDEELREEQYWDNRIYNWRQTVYNWRQRDNPCHPAYYEEGRFLQANILASDLGLIVKRGKDNSYLFATTDLVTTTPEPNTTITLYNYQRQPITTAKTDATGMAIIKPKSHAEFAIAQKGNNYAYLRLADGNALSMSKFDISGTTLQRGLKGMLYTERGVHRPGDSIHLTFVLDDKENPLPSGHPVKLEVTDARGKLIHRKVLNKSSFSINGEGGQTKSGRKGIRSKTQNGFYYFPITTTNTSPTGNYNATITVGGAHFSKSLKVETIKPNRLKVRLDFEDEILNASQTVQASASVAWLHGAPARNLKISSEVSISSSNTPFKEYPNYNFYDPIRSFEPVSFNVLDGVLDAEGNISFSQKLELSARAPGMLRGAFVTKAYEGGGDFSLDVITKDIAPFSHFVGVQSPKTRRYGSYFTDEGTEFDVVTTDTQGKAAGGRKLRIKVYQMSWRWWWNRGRDNYASYENGTSHTAVQDFEITTAQNGKGSFTVTIPDEQRGRYLIRVIDEESGHATGRIAYFYRNWSGIQSDPESAKILIFSADKETYKTGETATVNFPSAAGGRALISIENGTRVIDSWWVATQKGETSVQIPVRSTMAPNVYVHIALLQPHEQTVNDLPMRLYGVIPLLVEDQATILQPELKLPEVLAPEETYRISVSEKTGRPMTYTLAVVDQGLLDLTRFKTPGIHKHFYSRQALGVLTFDAFDDVIGAYSGHIENTYAVGGGDAAAAAKNKKAERFKPVVTYLGPFALSENKTATHDLKMANYIGSVRTMLIAGDVQKSAYGHTEKTVPVRKPLMVLGSLPRKLSPGEKVTLPVTVFAMEPKVKNVKITIKTSAAFTPLNGLTKRISFNEVGEQIVPFDFEVKSATGIQTVEILVEGAGERATYTVEIDVENPNPYTQTIKNVTLEANTPFTLDYETFGEAGTNSSTLEFSTLPPMNFAKRMEYLIRYPYGCVEQTTSSAFPQLYLEELFDMTVAQQRKTQGNIKAAINRLGNFQNPQGGLSYWPGESRADDWGTTYAGHFMIEARRKGYGLPLSFMNNWLKYQKRAAREWRSGGSGYNTTLVQAYRLYTLALAEQPDLAAMNRLREYGNLRNDARWRLAAAYAVVGQVQIANEIMEKASIDFVQRPNDYRTYGSVFRNRAMALETMVILGDNRQQDLAVSIAKRLSAKYWLSTQETSYALLALGKMVIKNGGKALHIAYEAEGQQETVQTPKSIGLREIPTKDGENRIQLTNLGDNRIYVRLIQSGKLQLGQELEESRKLKVSASYVDADGEKVNIQELRQGTEFFADVRVHNDSRDRVTNVALAQIFPSGWEIVNTRFATDVTSETVTARYTDIRDDRVYQYFDMEASSTKVFRVRLNASFLGTYYLPGSQAEAMYDNTYYTRNKGQWVTVRK